MSADTYPSIKKSTLASRFRGADDSGDVSTGVTLRGEKEGSSDLVSPMPSAATWNRILQEQSRSLRSKTLETGKAYPPASSSSILSAAEAALLITLYHVQDLVASYAESVLYIEHMLRTQLVAAIGKELKVGMFDI
jgi:hypothetical protein